MSIIAITHHDENITKIIDTHPQHQGASVTYKAKLRGRLKTDLGEKRHLKPYATMGVPQEHLPDPCDFLKKHSGKPAYSREPAAGRHSCQRKEKCFPTREQVDEYSKRREEAMRGKNFVSKNIKTVLRMKAKEPEPKVVVEPHGRVKSLRDGLEPVYIKSEAFGKTPEYLQAFIKKREKLHQMQKDVVGAEKPKCRYIRRDEREQLLEGLKHNWEELQKLYQGLPILTDTIPKINRKSKLEAELKQLEKDIVLVERHPYIYVYDDNVMSFN